MKTKIKRHSRSVLSVVLAVCMLVSCMTVGIIATDAAKVSSGDEAVGAKLSEENAVAAKADDSATVGASAGESVGATTRYPITIFFKPNSNWLKDSARIKYNFNKDNGSYVSGFMTEIDSTNHIFSATVPADKNKVQFLRWGPTTDDRQWNYSTNFSLPTDGKNLLTSNDSNYNNTNGTWSVYSPTTPYYALTGNIDSTYIASIGSTTNTLSPPTNYSTDAEKALWWRTYHSDFLVQNGSNGVYSITFTTQDSAMLSQYSHTDIDIGITTLYDEQYGFKLGSTFYNQAGSDYTIPSSGVSSSDNLYVQIMDSSNPGGSLQFQPGTTYTLTIDQTVGNTDNPKGKITITVDATSNGPSYDQEVSNSGVYLRGSFDNAVDWGTGKQFTKQSGDWLVMDVDLMQGDGQYNNQNKGIKIYQDSKWRGPNQDSNYGLANNAETTADGVNKSGNYTISSGGASRVFYNPTNYKFKYVNYTNTYTVFGATTESAPFTASIFGTAWDHTNANNDMTLQADGTYSIRYTDVPAGTYYYKVAQDHALTNTYPSANKTFTIVNSGASVVISYNPTDNEVTHYIVEGTPAPTPGTWTLYYMPDEGAARDEAMTETPAGSGIYKSNNKLDFINGSPNKTKIKFKNGTTYYGPESGSNTNILVGTSHQYNTIVNKAGDFVFNGNNGDYYVWLDTTKTGGNEADCFWLEGDEDDTSVSPTQGTMMDTTGWKDSSSSYKLVYKDSNSSDALGSATASSVKVYTKDSQWYADLTSLLPTIKSKSNNFHLGFASSDYSSQSDGVAKGRKIIGYHNENSSRTLEVHRVSGVDDTFLTKQGQKYNWSNERIYGAVINSISDDVTQLGIKLSPVSSSDWSTITYTIYAIKTASNPKPTVTVYAKDGMIRSGYQTFANTADTTIDQLTLIDGTVYDRSGTTFSKTSGSSTFSGSYTDSSGDYYSKLTSVPKGATIKFTTTLNGLSPKYYIKAFCINGVSYEVYDKNTTGSQTMTWMIPSDFKDNYVEITPIYYLNDSSNTKELKVEGFDANVQSTGWGNTLAVYPYYNGKSSTQNAFGGYPGQPFVFYGGKYYIQIPITHDGTDSGAEIRGLTLSNNYWDSRHKALDSTLDDHRQTYDYDDFFKLYREKNPDTIIIYYKYRVAKDNYGDGYAYEGGRSKGNGVTVKRAEYTKRGGGNGVETYLDYYDRDIDIFSNLITTDANRIKNDPSNKLLVISNGYVSTFAGDYATEWNIYKTENGGSSYSYVTSIAPSVLYMNDLDSWKNYDNGNNNAAAQLGAYKSAYTTLQAYKGWGVEISYEEEIRNYTKDQANRLDARWFYSKNTDKIQASVRIEYLNNGRYITDAFTNTNEGTVTGTKAYFTNTNPNIKGQVSSGSVVVNSEKNFTFEAQQSTTYKFVGWYLLRGDTYTEITDDFIGKSPMNSNDIYVARFDPMQSGTLTITHVIDPASVGNGTPYLTVTIKDGSNNIVEKFDKQTGKTFSNSEYINESYGSYTVEVSLETDADDNSYFTTGTNPITKNIPTESGASIYAPTTGTVTEKNATATKTFTVSQILAFATALGSSDESKAYNIQYYTTLNKYNYTYNYNVTYTYISRFWGKQKYVKTGTVDSNMLTDYITGKQGSARLTNQFLKEFTPYETTFRQLINWNYEAATQNNDGGVSNVYTITATVNATNTVNDKLTTEYRLPYRYTKAANTTWEPNPYTGGLLFDESVASDKVTTRIGQLFTTDEEDYIYDPETPWTDELAAEHPMVTAAESVYKVTLPEFRFNEYPFALYTGKTEAEYLADLNAGSGLTAAEIAYFAESDGSGNHDPYAFSEAHKLSAARELYDKAYSEQYLAAYKAYYSDVYTFGTDTATTRRYSFIELDNSGVKEEHTDTIVMYTPNFTDIKTTDTTKIAKKYFSYWNVVNTRNEFVTKVYSLEFNYSAYDNYFATPVYESDEEEFRALRGQQGTSTTITYLGETRNQWNVYSSDAAKNFDGTDLTGSTVKLIGGSNPNLQNADKILEDFALAYVHNGEEISKLSDDVQIGVVIQQLDELDTLDGSYITAPSYYQNKYSGTVAASITLIQSLSARTTTVSSGDAKGVYVRSPLANGKESLDNKNRLAYYFTFNNHKAVTGTSTTPTTPIERSDKIYAYRAFTYIKIGSADMVVSTTPAYFTFYDLAMM